MSKYRCLSLLIVSLVVICSTTLNGFSANKLEIHFMDVGQGDSTLVICPNGKNILIDAGTLDSNHSEDPIRDYVLEQINRDQGKINTLIITHPDKDHYIFLPEILRGVRVDKVFRVGTENDYNTLFWKWLSGFRGEKMKVLNEDFFNPINAPNSLIDCGEAEVYILAAAVKSKTSRKNAMSIVVMIRYGDIEAILTGDATHATERKIMQRYPENWLDVEILKIGHHGSLSTSTGTSLANTTKPEIAVSSSGINSRFGHPRGEVIQRLEPHTKAAEPHPMSYAFRTDRRGVYRWENPDNYTESIYSTAANGYIVVETDGNEISIKTLDFEEMEE